MERGIVMVKKFPWEQEKTQGGSAIRMRLDMIFDVPEEIVEQLELWGLDTFENCEYDPTIRQVKMSASTILYRKGA